MSTQHHSEIAKELYSLILGNCPKGCKEKLSFISKDIEKRKYALANQKRIFQKCEKCGFTAEIH